MRQAWTYRLQVAMNGSILRELLDLTIRAGSSPSTGQESEASMKKHKSHETNRRIECRTRDRNRKEIRGMTIGDRNKKWYRLLQCVTSQYDANRDTDNRRSPLHTPSRRLCALRPRKASSLRSNPLRKRRRRSSRHNRQRRRSMGTHKECGAETLPSFVSTERKLRRLQHKLV